MSPSVEVFSAVQQKILNQRARTVSRANSIDLKKFQSPMFSACKVGPRVFCRQLSGARLLSGAVDAQKSPLLLLKFNGGASNLYAVFRLHNMPYLVTKGDRVVLPFKLKGAEVGDQLNLNDIITVGSPEYTYNDTNGVPKEWVDLRANVVEITKEPYYEVYRKKQRCRRRKTFPVQPYQTILMINELKLT